MFRVSSRIVAILSLAAFMLFLVSRTTSAQSTAASIHLDAPKALDVHDGRVEVVTYRGRQAVHLQPPAGQENADGSVLAVVAGTDFKDGTIEIDLAGVPRAGAAPTMKGFIGVAFRVQPEGKGSELIYLRPSNARADDQLTRNHSLQYVSEPDYSWQRLRKKNPGVYESYTDLEPGVWTRMKIEVSGTKARLFVNGAAQPALVVNDLKRGESRGTIALWAHDTTEAYFANLTVK